MPGEDGEPKEGAGLSADADGPSPPAGRLSPRSMLQQERWLGGRGGCKFGVRLEAPQANRTPVLLRDRQNGIRGQGVRARGKVGV